MFGMPKDVSLDGWRIDWLIGITTVFVAIMFLVTTGWIIWSCVFHGKKHRAHYDHGDGKSAIMKALVFSAVVFLVVDGNLFVSGMADLNDAFWADAKAETAPNAVLVQVNAHQWAWDFRYAGPDGTFNTKDDIVMLNELKVPVNAPIVLQLAATDVLHSFSLPNFRVKQDAVPGTINRLWFQAKETGGFDIACAQHCGVNHYKMRGHLTVMTPADFSAWQAEASRLAKLAFDPDDKTAHWGWDWKRGIK